MSPAKTPIPAGEILPYLKLAVCQRMWWILHCLQSLNQTECLSEKDALSQPQLIGTDLGVAGQPPLGYALQMSEKATAKFPYDLKIYKYMADL